MIKAEIIADSVNPDGHRLTTFVCTFPRWILAEINTHRALSRNSASSRAIPTKKLVKAVEDNPAVPIQWSANRPGMSDGGVNVSPEAASEALRHWRNMARNAAAVSSTLGDINIHKQVANRPLEPYLWHTALITATDWSNFFALRVHVDSQPDFQRLAYLMLRAYVEGSPAKPVHYGGWHIPLVDGMPRTYDIETRLKIATARAARVSYDNMDNVMDVSKDCNLHDKLKDSGHWSPFEHSARAVSNSTRHHNLVGWQSYRAQQPDENRVVDLKVLLDTYRSTPGNLSLANYL